MPVNDTHFAVLVGLSKYPRLGEPPPSDLEGPANDVEAVRQWMIDPQGGGVPEANIFIVTSPASAGSRGAPSSTDIQRIFEDLALRAEDARTGLGAELGKRLYVYASGHGFSPKLNQGCLHAGDASSLSRGANVFFTEWVDQFQDAGYFRETVLWMDCCMNRDSADAPALPTVKPRISSDPPGPSFIGFAARRPLRAVEKAEADGQVHGIFTTILLEGLRGAAANAYGMISGRSLADWLRNAQYGRMRPEDLEDPRVSKEPEIIREDPELIFARGMPVKRYPVSLEFPAGTATARLWKLRPPRSETLTLAPDDRIGLDLAPGMYVVDAPGKNLRQGFQVTSAMSLKIDRPGPAVAPTEAMAPLTVEGSEPGSEIFIVDEAFNLVDRGIDRLAVELPFGIYKVRIRSGRRMSEEVHLLDSGPAPPAAAAALPPFASAAPLPGTALSHEYHEAAVEAATKRIDVSRGSGSGLIVVARQYRSDDSVPSAFEPWTGIRVTTASGDTVADLSRQGERLTDRDPVATLSLDLDPGTYFLRTRSDDGRVREQSVVLAKDWRTQVHLLRAQPDGQSKELVPLRMAMFMHRPGAGPTDPLDLIVDQARVALADERMVLGQQLQELLIAKFDNPLAGIIGGHLLVLEHARKPSGRIEQLDVVVRNLRQLVGDSHPDVEALSLRCVNSKLRARNPITEPPMFLPSWNLIVAASAKRPALLPAALWQRVHAFVSIPPFMSWAADAQSKRRNAASLRANLGIEAEPPAPAALDAVGVEVEPAFQAVRRPRPRIVKERLDALGLPAVALVVLEGSNR